MTAELTYLYLIQVTVESSTKHTAKSHMPEVMKGKMNNL